MQSSFVTNFLTQGSAGWKQRHPSLFQPTLISPPFFPHSHPYLYHLSQYHILQPSVLASSSILTSNLHPYSINSSIYNPLNGKDSFAPGTMSRTMDIIIFITTLNQPNNLDPIYNLSTNNFNLSVQLPSSTSPQLFSCPPPIPLPPNHQNYSSIVS